VSRSPATASRRTSRLGRVEVSGLLGGIYGCVTAEYGSHVSRSRHFLWDCIDALFPLRGLDLPDSAERIGALH